jgi:hypothetical protein
MLCFVNSGTDDERNRRVRDFVRARVDGHYKGVVSAYSKAIGAATSTVNEMLQGKRGAGLSLVARIAAEAETTADVVTGAVPADASAAPALGGTAWGNLDGWAEAEDEVRKSDKRWSDWQFAKARAIRGIRPPVPVTPSVVVQALMLVFATTPPEELARLEAEKQDKELARLQKAAETREKKHRRT